MISAVVFSKDRALQLDALLRSVELHAAGLYDEVFVLWTSSSEEYLRGYLRLRERWPEVHWIEQDGGFRSDLMLLLSPTRAGLVALHCDDDLFYRDLPPGLHELALVWGGRPERRSLLFSYSLRLGRNTQHCYTLDVGQQVPVVNPWPWQHCQGDFGYPFSLDGHLYRADVLARLLHGLGPFSNPNELEARGDGFVREDPALWGTLLACPPYSCVVSLPLNRVQDQFPNRTSGRDDLSAAALNERFLAGERIDVEATVAGHTISAAHQELEPVFAVTTDLVAGA